MVTFNPNGGSGGPNKMYGVGDTTIPSDVPVKADSICIGWSTDPSATSAMVAPGGTYNITSDVTLYAVWRSEYVTITFDANGGTGGPSTQRVRYGESSTLKSSTPSKSGYVFDDWRSPATGSPFQIYHPGGTYTFTSDMTLTAMWDVESSGGGSGSGSGTTGDGDFATCNHEYYYNSEGEKVDIVKTSGYLTTDKKHLPYYRCTRCGGYEINYSDWYRTERDANKVDLYGETHLADYEMRGAAVTTCDICGTAVHEWYLTCYICKSQLGNVITSCSNEDCPGYHDGHDYASYGWTP